MLIEDPDDPFARPSGFGDRNAFDKKEKGPMVWITLPTDFGSAAYATRRAGAIDEHLDFIIRGKDQLRGIFDYWLEPSGRLRQYLWAHRPEDVKRAESCWMCFHRTWSSLCSGFSWGTTGDAT